MVVKPPETHEKLILCICLLTAFSTTSDAAEKRVVVLSCKESTSLQLKVGEIVQVDASYSLTIKSIGRTFDAQFTGDRALKVIGQSYVASQKDGRSGQSIFIYAVEAGKTKVKLTLVEVDGHKVAGCEAEFVIEVK